VAFWKTSLEKWIRVVELGRKRLSGSSTVVECWWWGFPVGFDVITSG
jgi:hypothetical protein